MVDHYSPLLVTVICLSSACLQKNGDSGYLHGTLHNEVIIQWKTQNPKHKSVLGRSPWFERLTLFLSLQMLLFLPSIKVYCE